MTWGGHATDAAPGAPMPEHGKSLGKIAAADFKNLVEKGLVQYGEFVDIHIHVYIYVITICVCYV